MTNIELNSFQEIDINKDKQLSFDEIKAISSDIGKKDIFKQILEGDIKNKELNEAYKSIGKDFKEFLIKDGKIDKNDIGKIYIIQIIAKIEGFYDNDLISKWNNDIDWVISKIFNYEELNDLGIGNNINQEQLKINQYIDFSNNPQCIAGNNKEEINKDTILKYNKLSDLSYHVGNDEIDNLNETEKENYYKELVNKKKIELNHIKNNVIRSNHIKFRKEKIKECKETIDLLEELLKNKDTKIKLLKCTNDKESGYQANLVKDNNGELTYCIRGSHEIKDWNFNFELFSEIIKTDEFKNNSDKMTYLKGKGFSPIINFYLFLFGGNQKSHIKSMLDDYDKMCSIYGNGKDINITGHSLGGGLAQILSILRPCKNTFTFNRPGMNDIFCHTDMIINIIEKDLGKCIDKKTLEEFKTCQNPNNYKNEGKEIYNIVGDELSNRYMPNHIGTRIDLNKVSENERKNYLEHGIRENRENIINTPDDIFEKSKRKETVKVKNKKIINN